MASPAEHPKVSRAAALERLLYVVLFFFVYSVAEVVLGAVVLIQFGFVLITGARNENLLGFGASLSRFIYEVFLYMTFNRDDRPFPFQPWPRP